MEDDAAISEIVTINWRAGGQALATALFLASISVAYHMPLALVASVAVAAYGLASPMRLVNTVLSLNFLVMLVRSAVIIACFAAVFRMLSIAINSNVDALSFIASSILLCLLGITTVIMFRTARRRSAKIVGRLASSSTGAISHIRFQLELLSLSLLPHR